MRSLLYEKFVNCIIKSNKLLKFEDIASKSDTIHKNIQINGAKLVYKWATTKVIFDYTDLA